jgi:hypothetical protein
MLLLHWEYAKTCFHPPTKFAPTLGVDKKIFVRKMLYVLKDSDLSLNKWFRIRDTGYAKV